jgi:site-specific recombinase XerD
MPVTPSLADVLTAIAEAADLSRARRQDMASAVRTIARVLGRPPEVIPTDPVLLGRRLAEVSPTAQGVSKERWTNVRSLLLSALALTRPMLPGRHREPASPGWKALSSSLQSRRHATRLSRLFSWLSARGIGPETVTLDDLVTFGLELREASLTKKPEETWREVCSAWNRAQQAIEGWPAITLTAPKRRIGYTFPWANFHPSLKIDVDGYLDRLSGTDLLEETPFRPVRQSTRDHRELQFRTFASALVHRGHDPQSLRSLADLVVLEAYKDGLRYLIDRHGGTSSTTIEQMAMTLKAVAKHYIKLDRETLDRMAAIIRKLSVKTHGMTEKNRSRLRAFEDFDNTQALLKLPARLMREAAAGSLPPQRAALLAQTAVAIEILTMAPIRLSNLAALDLDHHLVRLGRARDQLHIVLGEVEVKNRLALDYPLPEESTRLIEQYVTIYRTLLAGPANRALFPGRGGGHKSLSMIRSQIISAVFRYTGLRVNPHLFRHIGAKSLLDAQPGAHSVITRLLGHKSMNTALKFYTGMETTAAVRHFTKTILALRHGEKGDRQ